ncbi:hypothetical protein BKM31_46890 [[Actinomadura] parvosata subsp. kistnae]|uniref:Uncharacterized protein n=1 Tax=[Actinomadura] parvosata subsp. kistnae TaxID=1909395 RepID=A0A1V0ACS9_9ACTN|nr:hypothetical protein BKM31_46890 [Nonomuraea sp. ATCC 55076]
MSVRRPRSPYGIPAAAHCSAPPPDPTPSTSRPPDTYCKVATCLAAHTSGRMAGMNTLVPILMRVVAAAAVARAMGASSTGPPTAR